MTFSVIFVLMNFHNKRVIFDQNSNDFPNWRFSSKTYYFLTFVDQFVAFDLVNGKYFRNLSPFSVVLKVFRDFLEIFLRFFVIKNEMFETFSRFLISKYRLLVRSRFVPPLRTSLFF